MLANGCLGGRLGRSFFVQVFDTATLSFFDKKKTLFLEEPTAKPPKIFLKDDGNKYFVVIKYKDFQFDETTVRN